MPILTARGRSPHSAPGRRAPLLLPFLLLAAAGMPALSAQAAVGLAITPVASAGDTLVVYRWYPAEPGVVEEPLTVAGYVLPAVCGGPSRTPAEYREWLSGAQGRPADPADLARGLELTMSAVLDAPPRQVPVTGRVLMLSGIAAEPWFHASLGESLAAAGIEALVWRRCPSTGGFDTATVRRQEDQARSVLEWSRVTRGPARAVLVAWSFGGLAAARLAAVDPDVHGLVSLDAAVAYQYGEDLLRALRFQPASLRGPLLWLEGGVPGRVARSRWIADSSRASPRVLARVPGIPHAGFVDPYLAWSGVAADDPGRRAHHAMRTLVTRFVGDVLAGRRIEISLPDAAWRGE